MDWPLETLIDEIVSKVESFAPRKILFLGDQAEKIASYVSGWMAARGIATVVLDGTNRFDPYGVSAFARKMLIPADKILKKILIARAFTCYQMTTLVRERLAFLDDREGLTLSSKPSVIIIGPMNTFLDEDIREDESRFIFSRFLRRIEEMSLKNFRFFLFQSTYPEPGFVSLSDWTGGSLKRRLSNQRRLYFTMRLLRFSDSIWKISLEDKGIKIVMVKDWIGQEVSRLK